MSSRRATKVGSVLMRENMGNYWPSWMQNDFELSGVFFVIMFVVTTVGRKWLWMAQQK